MKQKKDSWKNYAPLAAILLLTIVVYLSALKNGFVWDDEKYIINNGLLTNLSWEGIKAIFSNFRGHNYAPVTDLVNAVQYSISGLSPAAFHFGSLFFHLLNVALVFRFITLLCDRWEIASVAALFFGIHPMQVESVAWASGGSNLFCATFFLGSLIAYLYFLRSNLKRYLAVSLLFFVLSMLSKAVAVVLPAVIMLIDYYRARKITMNLILEKIPFLALAAGVGVLSMVLRNQAGVSEIYAGYNIPQRIVFACFGFITYLWKLVLPLHLSAFYPYPVKSGEAIPVMYYLYLIGFIVLAGLVFYSLRNSKKIFFGLGFFTLTILVVLQIIPISGVLMADRYSYIPSIGIFYLAGEGFYWLRTKYQQWMSLVLLGVFTIFFSVTSYARCGIWHDDKTLWNDVIDKYQTIPFAYFNRGTVFKNEQKNAEALSDFTKAIGLKPDYIEAYNNRGVVYTNENRNAEALEDFTQAIRLNPADSKPYFNRGMVNSREGRNAEAVSDFTAVIKLEPTAADAYFNRANIFAAEKRNVEAISDFTNAIALLPTLAEAYNNRGLVYADEKRNEEALQDYQKAVELKPSFADACFNMGYLFLTEKKYEDAISSFTRAIGIRPGYATAYFNRAVAEFNSGKKEAACQDLKQAAALGYQPASDIYLRVCK